MSTATIPSEKGFFRTMRTSPSGPCVMRSWATAGRSTNRSGRSPACWTESVKDHGAKRSALANRLAPGRVEGPGTRRGMQREAIEARAERLVEGERLGDQRRRHRPALAPPLRSGRRDRPSTADAASAASPAASSVSASSPGREPSVSPRSSRRRTWRVIRSTARSSTSPTSRVESRGSSRNTASSPSSR